MKRRVEAILQELNRNRPSCDECQGMLEDYQPGFGRAAQTAFIEKAEEHFKDRPPKDHKGKSQNYSYGKK